MNDVEIARRSEALRQRLARGVERLRSGDATRNSPAPSATSSGTQRPLRGAIQLPQFAAPVEIVTDRFGVAHVTAASRADLYRAQGFLHVAERGWQIELNARRALGTLAELLGPAALSSDQFIRRIGVPEAAALAVEAAPPETRQVFEWYAEGQRASIRTLGATAEQAALRAQPIVPDAMTARLRATALFMLLSVRLQHDWLYELMRLSITATDRSDGASAFESRLAVLLVSAFQRQFGKSHAPAGGGSNAWAVSASRSATGGAVIAGDPHLANQLPGNWYAMHLACPGVDVIGASLPGVPDILFGHNGAVGWANTFAPATSTECVVEQMISPSVVRRPEGTEQVATESRHIAVAGGETHVEECASTSNGALLGLDVTDGDGASYDVALRFAAWEDPYPQHVIAAANTAKSGNQLASILGGWRGMAQTVVYADRLGDIGVVQTGVRFAVTVRAVRYGWEPGERAAIEPRHQIKQGGGIAVSANNVPEGSDQPEAGHWEVPLRAGRIVGLLEEGAQVPFNQSVRAQLDVRSSLALLVLPGLCASIADHVVGVEAQLLEDLRRWHGHAYRDLVEPTVFAAWYSQLVVAAGGRELGGLFLDSKAWLTDWGLDVVNRWIEARVSQPEGGLELSQCYRAALGELRSRWGSDSTQWSWGRAHRIRFRHALTGMANWPVRDVEMELPGFDDSVCRGDASAVPVGGPTFRMVVNMAEPDRSLWAWPVGNSGDPASPHWTDAKDGWARGRYHPMAYSRSAVNAISHEVLQVVPTGAVTADVTVSTPGKITK